MPLLDPSIIAEGIKPPQITNPAVLAEQANRAALLRQQVSQGPLKAQELANQVQSGQIDVQQKQKDQQDQETFHQAMLDSIDPTGKPDLQKAITLASPKMQIKNVQAIQKDYTDYVKAVSENTQIDRQTMVNKNSAIANEAMGLLEIPNATDRQTALPGVKDRLTKAKALDPNEFPDDLPLDDQSLRSIAIRHGAAAAIADQADKQAQARERQLKNTAETRNQATQEYRALPVDPTTGVPEIDAVAELEKKYPGIQLPRTKPGRDALVQSQVPADKLPEFDLKTAQATALKAFQAGDGGQIDTVVDQIIPSKDPMNASTKALLRSAAARGATMPEINQIIKDAYDQRGRVQVAKENAQNKISLDLSGLGGTSTQPSPSAQAVANYRIPLTTALGRGTPNLRKAFMDQVLAANPDFQEQYYNTFQKTENDATTGKTATSANALNTMMGHLSVLNSAADALKNGDVQAINRIANFIGAQAGQTPVTTYNTIVHRVGPEVTKAYLDSGGTVGERGTNEQDFDSKLGPDQIKQNIGVSALLADSKIKALQDQYTRGTYGKGKQKLISDEAEQARQALTKQSPASLQAGKQAQGGYQIGHLYGKLEYLGGDPKDQHNWKQH
jgi:hypothetical protein